MSWPQSKARFWETAPMFRLLLPLVTGIYIYDRLRCNLSLVVLCCGGLLLLLNCVCLLRLAAMRNWLKRLQWLVAQICYVGLGYVLGQLQAPPVAGAVAERSGAISLAVLSAAPEQRERSTRLKVWLLTTGQPGHFTSQQAKALLYLYQYDTAMGLRQGDTIVVPANWQAIRNSGNPFGFDYAAYCYHNGVSMRQTIPADKVLTMGKSKEETRGLQAIHAYCIRQLEQHIEDRQALALLKAMLTGDESDMDPQLRQAYSDTGIVHIVSISGAHVSLVFAVIVFLMGWLRDRRYRWLQYLLGFAFIWGYVLMAGSAAPAVRAALMFTIVAVGTVLNRQSSPLNQLFTAAFLMLLLRPFWLFAVGFQLSFLAMLSLFLFYRPIANLWQPAFRPLRWLWSLITASLAAELLIAPLCAWYFHSFPPLFLLANIIAGIAMSLVLVAGMLLLVVGNIPVASDWLAKGTEWLIIVFHKMVYQLQSWSPEAFRRLQLDQLSLLLLYVLIACGAYCLLQRNKKALFLGLSLALGLVLVQCGGAWQHARQRLLIVYNSGRECRTELISAGTYQVCSGTDGNTFDSKLVHIGFRSHQHDSAGSKNAFMIGAQRVCIWHADSPLLPGTACATDILILEGKADTTLIAAIDRNFSPRVVVLANDQPRVNIPAWQRYTAAHQIRMHYTAEDGAYVLRQ